MRRAYRDVELYVNERPPCAIDLSDNTNLWGMPPAASAAAAVAAGAATRYPGVYARELKAAIASYIGVTPDMVVTGCGSDDVLDSALRALGEPGERVAHATPTFPMAATFARMNALLPVAIPLTAEWDVDPGAFLAAGAGVTYLCSPNNPNGQSLSRASIESIVERSSGYVILDEAYAEFADRSDVDLLARSERLIITRTMSKAFGLAGLRVGYAVGAPDVIAEIEKSRGPYKVNRVAERAAIAALTEDREWVSEHIALVRENRERLRCEIATLDSDANFVFVPMANGSDVARRLRANGIAVRPFDSGIRITIGPWDLMQACIDAIGDL
ncbi:MAG TPA: histidinol-phosphate transaminase [Gemmatimonadaceae bacterium]|nr:histidinol-phosphate transaminase [Gemmatimonadaceae bacterium]